MPPSKMKSVSAPCFSASNLELLKFIHLFGAPMLLRRLSHQSKAKNKPPDARCSSVVQCVSTGLTQPSRDPCLSRDNLGNTVYGPFQGGPEGADLYNSPVPICFQLAGTGDLEPENQLKKVSVTIRRLISGC